MLFDLCNTSVIFQVYINDVLRDFLDDFYMIYLDDVFIYIDDTHEKHVQYVHQVLQCLLDHDLYAKLEKCEFHIRETRFLGFIVSSDDIAMDSEHIFIIID